MDQKEMSTQIGKLLSDNPAKFIKIRDTFDEMFEGRTLNGAQSLSDLEYERLRERFRDIDVPLVWCTSKEVVCQLYKAVNQRRMRDDDNYSIRTSKKSKKKGLFGGLFS